jgi:hypothetical protein
LGLGPPPGQRVPRAVLAQLIPRGSMGTAWRHRRDEPGRSPASP